jgi:hypothetical protein
MNSQQLIKISISGRSQTIDAHAGKIMCNNMLLVSVRNQGTLKGAGDKQLQEKLVLMGSL